MHGLRNKAELGHLNGKKQGSINVLVWDLPVRLFHWSLVASVAVAAITGLPAPEWWLDVHYWAGSPIGLLIAFRIAWGFYGTWHARFKSFLFSPGETIGHLRAVLRRNPSHYTGHNPAGALMGLALLGVLGALTVTGVIVLGGQESIGITAGFIPFTAGASAARIHEILAYILLAMIGAHLLGVLGESIISKQNLVRAMITGCKTCNATDSCAVSPVAPHRWRATGIVVVILIGSSAASWALIQTNKPAQHRARLLGPFIVLFRFLTTNDAANRIAR